VAIRKELATELKELDVDRVDAVDRPATGRAFALYKSEGDKTMATEITKDQLSQLLKNYASVATAADMLLKALRKDAAGKVSKSTAIAVNGLAQIMGAEPVFVSKAVPTQPYEYSEPDVDKRGPADEDLGSNFTPRSMPGSMVGRVQFSVKAAYAAPKKEMAPSIADEAQAEEHAGKPTDTPWASPNAPMAKAIADAVEAGVAKALKNMEPMAPKPAEMKKVEKTEGKDEKPAARPESKQVMTDEQRAIRKNAGYRFGESFANVVFEAGR
jgi:hypothetical protein